MLKGMTRPRDEADIAIFIAIGDRKVAIVILIMAASLYARKDSSMTVDHPGLRLPY